MENFRLIQQITELFIAKQSPTSILKLCVDETFIRVILHCSLYACILLGAFAYVYSKCRTNHFVLKCLDTKSPFNLSYTIAITSECI